MIVPMRIPGSLEWRLTDKSWVGEISRLSRDAHRVEIDHRDHEGNMNTTDINWNFKLARAGDRMACGPQYTMFTDKHHVTVFKSRDTQAYQILIVDIKTGKRLYESRFDKFYKPSVDSRIARDVAIAKLGRFSL